MKLSRRAFSGLLASLPFGIGRAIADDSLEEPEVFETNDPVRILHGGWYPLAADTMSLRYSQSPYGHSVGRATFRQIAPEIDPTGGIDVRLTLAWFVSLYTEATRPKALVFRIPVTDRYGLPCWVNCTLENFVIESCEMEESGLSIKTLQGCFTSVVMRREDRNPEISPASDNL